MRIEVHDHSDYNETWMVRSKYALFDGHSPKAAILPEQ